MACSEKLVADSSGLTDHDVAQLASDGLAPIHGFVRRHGQSVPFTLDISRALPEPRGMALEQFAIIAIVLASFIGPIRYLIG